MDFKQWGMLDDIFIIWGGEFGCINYFQGIFIDINYGCDYYFCCFIMWMVGGGIKFGIVYGEMDDFGYNIIENLVYVYDFQVMMFYLLGIDYE